MVFHSEFFAPVAQKDGLVSSLKFLGILPNVVESLLIASNKFSKFSILILLSDMPFLTSSITLFNPFVKSSISLELSCILDTTSDNVVPSRAFEPLIDLVTDDITSFKMETGSSLACF